MRPSTSTLVYQRPSCSRSFAWLTGDRSLVKDRLANWVHVQISSRFCADKLLCQNEPESRLFRDVILPVRHASKRVHCLLVLLLKALLKGFFS